MANSRSGNVGTVIKRSNSNCSPGTEPVQASQETEAGMMYNHIAYKSNRVNELANILFDRLEYYMTEPRPTACENDVKEAFSSGYFSSLAVASRPVDDAISRLEEILIRLAV
jgi:hypothetical protein